MFRLASKDEALAGRLVRLFTTGPGKHPVLRRVAANARCPLREGAALPIETTHISRMAFENAQIRRPPYRLTSPDPL